MATLCEDIGWGRVSSKAAQVVDNHLAWKKTNREKRARMRFSMEARKYGRNEDDTAQSCHSNSAPDQSTVTNEAAISAEPSSVPVNGGQHAVGDTSGSGFDYSQDVATSRYNVQIRIGPNGETIIDEESLFVDRNVGDETADYTHVEESDVSKFVNSGTYGRRFRGSRWSAEETELFYDVSNNVNTNGISLIYTCRRYRNLARTTN
jgi:transcription factor TFIIIB component B''